MNEDESEQGPIAEDDSLLEQVAAIMSAQSSNNESSPAENTDNTSQGHESSQESSEDEEDDEDDEDDEAKKEAEEKERKGKAAKIKKKLKDDSKKKLVAKIGMTFLNPATTIPADIQQSLKETGKSIKDTSQKAMQNQILKPQEKAEAVKEIALENAKVGAKETVIQTILKAIREVIKKLYKTAPVAAYVWAATAIIVAILFVLLIILAIMIACSGSASGGAAATEPQYMTENFSITSEYFYGVRTAYIDEDALISSLKQSYQHYVSDVIVEIEESGIDVKIDIITINEETKLPDPVQGDSVTHYNTLSLNIGNAIAGKSETEFTSALYNEIPYFGLTAEQQSNANSIIVKYIKDNSLFTLTSAESFPDDIVSQLDSNSSLDYIENLCEKVMIRDYIAEENGLKDVQQLNYVGSIYMPNTDLIITRLSTAVSTPTPENQVEAECVLQNGEDISTITSGTTDSSDGKLILDSVDNSSLELSKFTSVSDNNEIFANGISLLEALRLVSKNETEGTGSNYFRKQTNDDGLEVYTWMPGCETFLYISYKSDNKFIFSDLIFEGSSQDDAA